ncbi:uncharacterized protein LOC135845350 [Planococcus citri]|uniref:uncharacterized protein LOC135845350 n=1 Tax=Planococcus citri TaxID=170843 RepID=UPI0031F988AC
MNANVDRNHGPQRIKKDRIIVTTARFLRRRFNSGNRRNRYTEWNVRKIGNSIRNLIQEDWNPPAEYRIYYNDDIDIRMPATEETFDELMNLLRYFRREVAQHYSVAFIQHLMEYIRGF